MSFFSSLVANVTSGVANLSSRRFSLSRQDSNEGGAQDTHSKTSATPSITISSSGSSSAQHHHGEILTQNCLNFPNQISKLFSKLMKPKMLFVLAGFPKVVKLKNFWPVKGFIWRLITCCLSLTVKGSFTVGNSPVARITATSLIEGNGKHDSTETGLVSPKPFTRSTCTIR